MLRERINLYSVSLLLTAAFGCQGRIGEGDDLVGDDSSSTPVEEWPQLLGGISDECVESALQVSDAPLRRLTAFEYENTLHDLFDGLTLPEVVVAEDARVDGFSNAAISQASSPLAVEQYKTAAIQIARVAAQDLGPWAPCADATAACARTVLHWAAEKAYRRPLDGEESAAFEGFVNEALAQDSPVGAIEMGLEALLQSPSFLYRPEFGSGAQMGGGAVRLSAFEMASRLSYFFLASMPDDELLAAARSGDILTPAGYRAHAERLLADPRARPVLTDFFVQWLGLYKLDDLQLDSEKFPEFTPELREDLKESAIRYVAYALWEEDSWVALTAGSYGFVNDRLAPLFGVPAPGTEQLVYMELDPAQRRGVLTQPGTLASTSHGARHSPILRGVTVLNRVLCVPQAAPPADALTQEPAAVDGALVCTTRDDVSLKHTSKAGCQDCHQNIDGVGFSFEHYDALGRFRTEENGCAIDAQGFPIAAGETYFAGTDVEGELNNALVFADRMSASQTATSCFADHVFRFALGRKVDTLGQCEVDAIAEPLLEGQDSLQGLLLNLVMSPSFLSRPQTQ